MMEKQSSYRYYVFLPWAISIFLVTSALGQTRTPRRATTPPCTLTLENAPHVRGFYLGMTVGTLLELYPEAREAPLTPSEEGTGVRDFFLGDVPELSAGSSDVYVNTTKFVDDRLAFVAFTYQEFEPRSAADFVLQAAPKLGLPQTGWRAKSSSSRELRCEDFTVTLQTGDEGFRQDHPTLILADHKALAVAREREQEKKRREVERRLREERERHIFKP